MMCDNHRKGLSLIEVLIVIAILGLLFALVLAAIQRVRISALRTQSENNLRQIILATHQLADTREGQIKSLPATALHPKSLYNEQSVFWAILPWTYGERSFPPPSATPEQIRTFMNPVVKTYFSPADPSLHFNPVLADDWAKCSYAANMLVFDNSMLFPFSVPDGTASTLAFAERYYYCQNHGTADTYISYEYIFPMVPPDARPYGQRRATFADRGWGDVMPEKDASTGMTAASIRGKVFQVRPRVEDGESNILQTPFSAGLPVAFFDGSVRTLSSSISENIFWSLVSPNGGEVIGDY